MQTVVDLDAVLLGNPLAEVGRRAVHGYAARGDPRLHVATRAEARAGEHLLQLLARRRAAVVGRGLRGGGDFGRGPLVVARRSVGLRRGNLSRRGGEVEALGDLFKGRQLL